MNKELYNSLEEYQKYTIDIVVNLEHENYSMLKDCFDKRQQVLDIISSLIYSKDEFTNIYNELKLQLHEKKLSDMMLEKRDEVKQNINKLVQGKNANNNYNKKLYGSSFFNKTI